LSESCWKGRSLLNICYSSVVSNSETSIFRTLL
jgi:hypothetical protein